MNQLSRTVFSFLILVISIFTLYKEAFALDNNPIIPRQVLFGNPDKAMVRLSPDGKYISYLAPKNGVLNVWLALVNKLSQAKPVTDDKVRGIREYFWTYDNRNIIYVQDNNGDENFRLYTYNINTQKIKLLTPENGVKVGMVVLSSKIPNEMLIGLNERDNRYFDVFRLNIDNLSQQLVFENNKYTGFLVDDNLDIRFAVFANEKGSREYFQFKGGEQTLFMEVPAEDAYTTAFTGFDKTGRAVYLVDSRNRNTAALKKLDLDSGAMTLIAEDDKADIAVFTVHPTEKTIQAVSINYDRESYKIT